MDGLLTLDDPRSADVERFGGKIGRLAAARQRGPPVLPGFVVPPECGARAIEAGATAVDGDRAGGARSAAWRAGLALDIVAQLRDADLPAVAIVRASTNVDEEPGWAGAFSSVHDVAPADVTTAATACLASAFAPRTLERFALAGRSPRALRMAVLVQPEVRAPAFGGSARLVEGRVEIRATEGSPAPLLAGAIRGSSMAVDTEDQVHGSLPGCDNLAVPLEVAALVRRVAAEIGCSAIEWLYGDNGGVLLQASLAHNGIASPTFPPPSGAFVGVPASPGRATGPVRLLGEAHDVYDLPRGDILVVGRPEPWYAPFLWAAGGLVSRDGDPAAHLFEVARSLHVPAVAQVDLPAEVTALALDGTAGWVRSVTAS
jgi:pyruvate,water dikinase